MNLIDTDRLSREVKNTYLDKSILTREEARNYLGISKSQMDKLVASGILPFYNPENLDRKKGRTSYFLVSDLNRHMLKYHTPALEVPETDTE